MPYTIIGIDPGMKGGIAVIQNGLANPDRPSIYAIPMLMAGKEIDAAALQSMLESVDEGGFIIAYIEKVGAMPKQGVSSTFKFGCGYGMIRGVLTGLGIPYQLVTPQAWKKEVLAGLPHDKAGAAQHCAARWPSVNLILPRCRTIHDGMADAVCIAEYGLKKERMNLK